VFPPGSEWLYLKVYSNGTLQDRLLAESLGPAVQGLLEEGVAEEWFFARLGDPSDHLRIRLRGEPDDLMGRALPVLSRSLETALGGRADLRWSLDTYDREFERYGGPEYMALSERAFCIDSSAVLAILSDHGASSAEVRWGLALCAMDQTVDLLELDLRSRRDFYTKVRDAYLSENSRPEDLRSQIAARFRLHRPRVETLLERPGSADLADFASGFAILAERSRGLSELIALLRRAEQRQLITTSTEDIASSWIHMFLNRLFCRLPRLQETALYTYLASFYSSKAGRDWQEARARQEAVARG